MSEPEQERYSVVLQERPAPNDLGEMTETEMYGYVRERSGMDAAEAVLQEVKKEGAAITSFDSALGARIRVEIRRVAKSGR